MLININHCVVLCCCCWQRANLEFTQAKVQDQAAASREQKLKDLAAAYDAYIELKGNLEEGTKVSYDRYIELKGNQVKGT